MIQWKIKFDESTSERGKQIYLNRRVTEFQELEDGYAAVVLGRERFHVKVKMKETESAKMNCTCPVSKMGRSCEHEAAVCWAVEAKKLAQTLNADEDTVIRQWKHTDAEGQKKQQEETVTKRKRRTRAEIEADKAAALEAAREAEEARQKAEKAERERRAAEAKAQQEREQKRQAREQRKAEKAKREEEARKIAEELLRREAERRAQEEARREQIRKQKAEEAARRAEKREKEQELQRQVEAKRREDQEKQRLAEEKRRKTEERKRLAEEKRQKEQEEEERRQWELEKKRILEKNRHEYERRRDYELLGGITVSEEQDAEIAEKIVKELEQYKYFDNQKILASAKISPNVSKKADKILQTDKMEIQQIYSGYKTRTSLLSGQMDVYVRENRDEFSIRVQFEPNRIDYIHCGCPKCRRTYYAWSTPSEEIRCEYKAAAVRMLSAYLDKHPMGDATDHNGNKLLHIFSEKHIERSVKEDITASDSLKLVPRLSRKADTLSLSFKVGAEKLYVIKQLGEFCRNVETSATDTYGTKTEINHDINNFEESSRKWISFISRIVGEEEMFLKKMAESRYYSGYQKSNIGSNLELFGWRLDECFRLLEGSSVEYEDKESGKKKQTITGKICNPEIVLQISPAEAKGVFQGITAEGSIPELYMGAEASYYIENGHLCRTEPDYKEKIRDISEMASNGRFHFQVGRNNLAEFYYRILPELQNVMTVVETDPDKIAKYLIPEAQFRFYLDAENHNILCRAYVIYGKREINLVDQFLDPEDAVIESFRDTIREQEVLAQMYQYLPAIDRNLHEFHCGGQEELVYKMLESGVERLQEIGEVHCTKRFLNINKVKKVKMSLGVSVSEGMLDLDIQTEGVSREELLDLLNSYRQKKKYYRMKDGSFVSLEDQALEMLKELQETMGVKPGEFIKGKMHLPLYRTLYLDRMLEEHEEVYNNRDRHFKNLVKGFKTIRDSSYEEPESLAGIMRNYQKDGYKWMRTLDGWNFGGILADDMGLGKTLQTIAVLLAAKQEGNTGTSLVVSPAALVFNWEEEFIRFAPELKVSVIAGTQSERQKRIEAYRDADVLITSYDLLKRDIAYYEDKVFEYEVIDEAQYIKNHTTAASKAVKVIRSRMRYALTGTPIENRLSELWSIFDYLMPGFLYGYDTFRRELELPIVKNKEEEAMARLQKLTGPFILRRLKENVLKELPDKMEECRYVRFDKTQQQLYDAQVIHMKESLAKQDDSDFNKNKLLILAELTKLRQICCAPSLCFDNYKGEAAKLEACMQLIHSAMDGGHRMLVFSQFTSMLDLLQKELDKQAVSYYIITGNTSKEKRLQLVKEFNEGEVPVFLISLKAGGVGLNLTGADVVIHYDPWWNVAAQNQATDRAHRIGQKKKVTVYKLIAKGTIEEKIQKLQEKKKDLADQVISGESGQLTEMSREDLLNLLEV